jgi:hypothetical protein
MSPDAITGELQLVNTYRAHLAAVTSALSPHAQAAPPVCQPRSERQALASSEEIRHVVRPAAHDRFHEPGATAPPPRARFGLLLWVRRPARAAVAITWLHGRQCRAVGGLRDVPGGRPSLCGMGLLGISGSRDLTASTKQVRALVIV